MSDAVRNHVRKILRARGAGREAEDAKIRGIEAAGGRIVDGGQLDNQTWEITDWRTGTRLAHGDGGLDGFSEAWLRLDPDGCWWHIDRIGENFLSEPSATDGVPPSLAEALQDWVEGLSTPDEEIAAVAGWDVAEVGCGRNTRERGRGAGLDR